MNTSSIFDDLKLHYENSIRSFNPISLLEEHKVLIENWKAPCERYLRIDSHNKRVDEIEIEQLIYLIKGCYMCSIEEQYKAIIVLMYRLYKKTRDLSLIDKAKWELIPFLRYSI